MYKISGSNVSGKFEIPSSKSHLHRLIIMSLLKRNKTLIKNVDLCDDTRATLQICSDLGCDVFIDKDILINSTNIFYKKELNCKKSASTFRMLVPVLIYIFRDVTFKIDKELLLRPFNGYDQLFENNCIKVTRLEDGYNFKGTITNPCIDISQLNSSQYASGMMILLTQLNKNMQYRIKKISSKGYLKLTCQVIKEFGYDIFYEEEKITYKKSYPNQKSHFKVDRCFSSYAFIKVMSIVKNIQIGVIRNNYFQPDQIIEKIISDDLKKVDINQCPDLFPILVVYSIVANKKLLLENCKRTIIKESNRFEAMLDILKQLRVNYEIDGYDLLIDGCIKKDTLKIISHDHRIAICGFVLSTLVQVEINDISCIDKSYESFVQQFLNNDGEIYE